MPATIYLQPPSECTAGLLSSLQPNLAPPTTFFGCVLETCDRTQKLRSHKPIFFSYALRASSATRVIVT